jgi:hypothetical protein
MGLHMVKAVRGSGDNVSRDIRSGRGAEGTARLHNHDALELSRQRQCGRHAGRIDVPVQDVVVTVNGADITSARAHDNHGFPDGTPVEFSWTKR